MAFTQTAQFPADFERDKLASVQAVFPTKLETTERQLVILTGVINRLEDVMVKKTSLGEGSVEFPEELVKKATDVSIQALHQVEEIMNDMCRWNLQTTPMEDLYRRYLGRAVDIQEAQLTHAKVSCFPHMLHNAEVYQVADTEWVATLGTGKNEYVLGRGTTAYDALRDFDHKFLNGYPPVVKSVEAHAKKTKKKVIDGGE